jgi:cyclophilin family peptidyl-prolyl cis-trans isomerase
MMFFKKRPLPPKIRALALTVALLSPLAAQATIVEMQTNMGNIDIQLFDTVTPKTVANFLAYVNSGAYSRSIIHRSVNVPRFIIQGGGYTWDNTTGSPVAIPTLAPVVNEYKLPNVAGTIAMAKLGTDPNSATDQWFFNLVDNSSNLDNQDGGFTVFGQVINNGMSVVNAIAALTTYDECSSSNPSCLLSNLPLISSHYLVMVNTIAQTLVDDITVALTSTATPFIPTVAGNIFGITLTNTQTSPVTVTLQQNSTTVMVVTVKANSTLNIPLPSGLAIKKSDLLHVNLPSGPSYSSNPVYIMFDAN